MISIPYIWTKDKLHLQGVHYESSSKDICVLFIYGMSGNAIENEFAHETGEVLSERGIGFIYSHNRGHSHINDIPTKSIGENGSYKTVRIGVMYERFVECTHDIQAWVDYVKEQGYKRLVIMGHSLGGPKTVYYLHRNKVENLAGVILCSPGDMVGLVKLPQYQENYEDLLKEARRNMENGEPRKLLSSMIWEWYTISSQTFLDLFVEEGPADIFPLLRNPQSFRELESVTVPILETVGEHDDIVIRSLEEDMDLLKSKAINCPSFTAQIIPGANHTYYYKGKKLGEVIADWLSSLDIICS